MFDRLFFSADLGDGGGGSLDGGVDAGAALEGGADGGDGGEAWDANAWVEQQGGREAVERMHKEHGEISNRYKYDPQFRDTLTKALRGDYGPQKQAEAQQQQAQQGGQQGQQQGQQPAFKYEPQQVASMQTFYRLLEQAKESGDPEAVQRVYNDPQNAKAKEAYLAHQDQMNNAWWDQRGHFQKMLQDPEHQEMLQQQYQQMLDPVVQEMHGNMKGMWYEANQQAVDSLPAQVRQALDQGFYGKIDPSSNFQEWKKAVQSAIQAAKQFAAQPNANAQQPANENAQPNATAKRMQQGPPKNGLKKDDDDELDGQRQYRKLALEMAKDKQKAR